MTQFLDTPVDKSLSATGAWTDIDLSGDVPTSATGAIFRVLNSSGASEYNYGLRKNGSTDARSYDILADRQSYAVIGLDANRKCEGYIESTHVDFFLVGYTGTDATFFTNGIDKSLTTTSTWTDIDLSSDIAAGAVAAIFEVVGTGFVSREFGLRKNGSTDDRHGDLYLNSHNFMIVGVDANRKCEGYIETTYVDFYLLGYLTMGQAETNAHDRSLGSTGSYADVDESGSAPAGATGIFGELIKPPSTDKFAARKNGTSFDYYERCSLHGPLMVGLDANRKWEGKIEDLSIDFFTMGYFMPGVIEKTSSDGGAGTEEVCSRLLGSVDMGTGTGALLSRVLGSVDVGSGREVKELLASLEKSDAGAGSESMAELLANLEKSDIGEGSENMKELLANLEKSDIGEGSENMKELLANLERSDVGTGADTISSLLAELIRSDSGTGMETSLLFVYILLKLLQEKKEVNLKLLQDQKQEVNLKLSCGDAEN